jgi:hypothetical protein
VRIKKARRRKWGNCFDRWKRSTSKEMNAWSQAIRYEPK